MRTITNEQLHYLHVLLGANPKLRKAILEHSSAEQVDVLSQCCLNFLHGTFKVKADELKQLQKRKSTIRTIANRRVKAHDRRKLLVQQGNGFLSLILPAAISLLSTILQRPSASTT
jgi:hypothetical protein